MISLLVFLPVISILIILALPMRRYYLNKWITLGTSLLQTLVALLLFITYDTKQGGVQFVEQVEWFQLSLGTWGIFSAEYFVGLDGLNIGLVLLSGIVMSAGALASWNIVENRKGYFALYLLLSSTVFGCFVALDFLLFFIFFEFMLLPMYFLIGMWGGERREYAAIKFFLYTLTGSIFILLVMIVLYTSVIDPYKTSINAGIQEIELLQAELQRGNILSKDLVHTFNIIYMQNPKNYIPGSLLHESTVIEVFGVMPAAIAFLALMIGFAVKLPSFPFHTWLPDAHVEAPTPVSIVLAGILLKIGGYGILRTAYCIFPHQAKFYALPIALLGVVSIIWAGFNALAQKDLKKMIAYSSVSHMGFVTLGIASMTTEGISGAIYQMISHGIIASLLFIIAGVLYDRTHDRQIENYRGLAVKMPLYTALVMVAFFASFGLPGFSGRTPNPNL